MLCFLLINVKMPTTVGILTVMSRKKNSCTAVLSMKMFYNLGTLFHFRIIAVKILGVPVLEVLLYTKSFDDKIRVVKPTRAEDPISIFETNHITKFLNYRLLHQHEHWCHFKCVPETEVLILRESNFIIFRLASLLKGGNSLRKRICSSWSQFFCLREKKTL